jgi:hypothetical protein
MAAIHYLERIDWDAVLGVVGGFVVGGTLCGILGWPSP